MWAVERQRGRSERRVITAGLRCLKEKSAPEFSCLFSDSVDVSHQNTYLDIVTDLCQAPVVDLFSLCAPLNP